MKKHEVFEFKLSEEDMSIFVVNEYKTRAARIRANLFPNEKNCQELFELIVLSNLHIATISKNYDIPHELFSQSTQIYCDASSSSLRIVKQEVN